MQRHSTTTVPITVPSCVPLTITLLVTVPLTVPVYTYYSIPNPSSHTAVLSDDWWTRK
jgi:hypothetical protein